MKLTTISFIVCLFLCWSNHNFYQVYSPQDELKESIERGGEIYNDFCVTCHSPDGKGVENLYPPLANSDYLLNNRKESIRGIKFGQEGKITVNGKVYDSKMDPPGLADDEIADVMNYITNSWGNKNKAIALNDVVRNRRTTGARTTTASTPSGA